VLTFPDRSEKNSIEILPHNATLLSLLAIFSRGTHRSLYIHLVLCLARSITTSSVNRVQYFLSEHPLTFWSSSHPFASDDMPLRTGNACYSRRKKLQNIAEHLFSIGWIPPVLQDTPGLCRCLSARKIEIPVTKALRILQSTFSSQKIRSWLPMSFGNTLAWVFQVVWRENVFVYSQSACHRARRPHLVSLALFLREIVRCLTIWCDIDQGHTKLGNRTTIWGRGSNKRSSISFSSVIYTSFRL